MKITYLEMDERFITIEFEDEVFINTLYISDPHINIQPPQE